MQWRDKKIIINFSSLVIQNFDSLINQLDRSNHSTYILNVLYSLRFRHDIDSVHWLVYLVTSFLIFSFVYHCRLSFASLTYSPILMFFLMLCCRR